MAAAAPLYFSDPQPTPYDGGPAIPDSNGEQQRFEALQRTLASQWARGDFVQEPQTVIVVPSVSLEGLLLERMSDVQHREERFLIFLLLLRQPRTRLIYVTSEPILPAIVDYYLHLLPGVIPTQARRRLFLMSTLDGSVRPLSEKILERPRLLKQIRDLIDDPERAHLVPYNSTELERELALRLGIPVYGADPKFLPFGSKSGARKLFMAEGVPLPLGHEDLSSLSDAVAAIAKMRAEKPDLHKVVLKTNEGVSGSENVALDLRGLPEPGDEEEEAAIERRLRAELEGDGFDDYDSKLAEIGGIVEERVAADEVRSPSVQFRITPVGEVELLSTHDQLLGGEEGQQYEGCRFPADPAYARLITQATEKIARRLAGEGVIGRAALDFVVARSSGERWQPFAIELNLRRGGTTHPFLTLQFLTDGTYDAERAAFVAPSGQQKFFVASDHVQSRQYRGLTPEDLFDALVLHGLHFDHARQTGVVVHMLSALSERGLTGLTAVENSPEKADALFDRAVQALDEEAQGAYEEVQTETS